MRALRQTLMSTEITELSVKPAEKSGNWNGGLRDGTQAVQGLQQRLPDRINLHPFIAPTRPTVKFGPTAGGDL